VCQGQNWRYRELLLESHHPPGDERGEGADSSEPPGAGGDPNDGHHGYYDGYNHGYDGHYNRHNGYSHGYDDANHRHNYCHHGHDDGCANRDDDDHHRRYHIGAGYYYSADHHGGTAGDHYLPVHRCPDD
jgi:hypothetical protein